MRKIERRVGLLFAGFLLCLVTILARAFWLQGVEGSTLASQAESQQQQNITVPGLRGRLLDRAGRELAASQDAATIYATPYQVRNPARTAARLAPLLGTSAQQLMGSLTERSGFSYVARKVDLRVAQRISQLHLAGIGQLPDSRRTYPQGQLAGQVVGAVGVDNQGLTGLEAGQDSVLHGADGERRVIKDALGEPIKLQTVRASQDGSDVKLTLDSAIQARTEAVLDQLGRKYSPKSATAIVIDPRSSQILAMANWPSVDPNDPSSVGSSAFDNQATSLTYEPGSTFKAITVAGALQDHLVTPQSMFHLEPTIQVADRTIKDAEPRGAVDLSVAQILAQSSNVGAVTVGERLGAGRFGGWVRRFGFGRPTGIQFPGEEQGLVPTPNHYSGSSMGNLPIGQGLSVTPIQMAAAYAAIANGGTMRRPQLLERVAGKPVPGPEPRRVISPRVALQLRRMLEGVLAPGGTASEVRVPGYTLAGKTGTAQKVVNGVYSQSAYVASFIGFAPALHPQLEAAVIVDQPQGDIYGGSVAAPAFGQIASFALPYLGIPPR